MQFFRRAARALVWRCYEHVALPILKPISRRFIARHEPRLAGVSQPLKVATIIRLLLARKPRSIVEFGAGLNSTPALAWYANKTGARLVSFEAIKEWTTAAKAASEIFGPVDLRTVLTEPSEEGVRYAAEIPADADFIFVDGPTRAGHIPTMNVPLWLRKGARPRTIVIDGRHPTIDAVLKEAGNYSLAPDFHYAFENDRWSGLLPIRHETVFTLTP